MLRFQVFTFPSKFYNMEYVNIVILISTCGVIISWSGRVSMCFVIGGSDQFRSEI